MSDHSATFKKNIYISCHPTGIILNPLIFWVLMNIADCLVNSNFFLSTFTPEIWLNPICWGSLWITNKQIQIVRRSANSWFPLFLQIKPRTQSTQASQHPNLCPCSLAFTPPGALSHTLCPAWCLLTWGSITLLLAGSMELWQLP